MTVSWILNASGHNYRNSSFIVDVAMGQILRDSVYVTTLKSLDYNVVITFRFKNNNNNTILHTHF